MNETALTERQQEIKTLLDEGRSASQIADALDITRNAVYSQIQAMRRKGLLPFGYTPSGAPPRGVHVDAGAPAVVQLAEMMRETADVLEAQARKLRAAIG